MLDDLEGRSTGERIKIIRERKGMSRPTLSGLVGRSAEWLKGIENGRRLPPRLPVLVRLAEILGVGDVSVLVGEDMEMAHPISLPIASFRRIPHEAVPAIREALQQPHLAVPDRQVDVTALRSRTDEAWRLWHTSPRQRTEVGRILPSLITDARIAARTTVNGTRRRAQALLADLYALCEQMLAWTSEAELVVLAADRGVTAAQEADRPETLAGAAWVLGNVRRAVGDYEAAVGLVDEAVGILRPRLDEGPDDLRAMWGALHLHAAITCARAGREGDAWRYWDEADRTADRLGDYVHPWTVFGKANAAVTAVSVGVDLSQSTTARDRAERIDAETVPSLDRRSRLMVEIARTYHLKRDYSTALGWLRRAHSVAPETVHYSPVARQVASDVVDHGGPLVERDARGFARTLDLPMPA